MAARIDFRAAVQGTRRNDSHTQVRCHARQRAATVFAEDGSESLRVRYLETANQILTLGPLRSVGIENDVTGVTGAGRFTAATTVTMVEKPEFP